MPWIQLIWISGIYLNRVSRQIGYLLYFRNLLKYLGKVYGYLYTTFLVSGFGAKINTIKIEPDLL